MIDLFNDFFSDQYMPHGHCYFWEKGLVGIHVISDLLIGLAYVSISLTLVYLVRRVRVPFHWTFLAFGLFIGACGGTHFMEILTVWRPYYWLAGFVKAITALASVATAVQLFPLLPKAVALVRSAELAEDRRLKLEDANKELSTLYRKVKEIDELKTNFFANVSHELRTPLALILGPVKKLLVDRDLTQIARKQLEVVERNARTLLKHVTDLLDISKLEAGKMNIHYYQTDLAGLVRRTASLFEALAQERAITFNINTPPQLSAALDVEKIQRVLLNLLSNAFKFVPDGGEITCLLQAEGERVLIAIEDNGPGIRPELRERIFDRFAQADNSATRRFGGTGLGLAIVKEFVELHQGSIKVSDTPGGGATFTINLPIAAPADINVESAAVIEDQRNLEADELAHQALEDLKLLRREAEEIGKVAAVPLTTDHLSNHQGNGARSVVLVVEDNLDMREFIISTLTDEYQVESAVNGKLGLEKALELRPDLILSDIMMPELSGDQLVAALRKYPEADEIPIIMLTAKADDDLRVQLLRNGAQDYVMKPFSVEEVRARIQNWITIKQTRKLLQKELASSNKDLVTLARELTTRKQELERAFKELEISNQLKDEFLATVSHELRTPLTSMLGWVRLLATDRLNSEDQQRAIATIERNTRAQASLVEDLLDMSRIISGKLNLDIQMVELIPLIEETVNSVHLAAEAKGVKIQMIIAPGSGQILGDPNRLRQVIYNLLTNAIKFTARGDLIQIGAARIGSHIEISIKDNGAGIRTDFLPYIFERFRQQDGTTTRKHGGLGLGLAIVKSIVELHGGTIEAKSEGEGQGAEFIIKLPQMAAMTETQGDQPDNQHNRLAAVEQNFQLEDLKILVLEDDADTRAMLTVILERQNAVVLAIADAREALSELERWSPDVIISDIGLPGLDGYEFIRRLRALEISRQREFIPALALTAMAKEEHRRQALASGFNMHISKPVEPNQLLVAVAELAKRITKN